ncbi:MAG TPA: ABC transporter ATP-binding protein [Chiayiivirga sp.]|nr:ABC transporter ATP-binding protein [Chiayiivirga sp.]
MTCARDTLARLQTARKTYGLVQALAGIDLGIAAGEVLAVLGPNGAGKSTAIGLLLGLLSPDSGSAELFGVDPANRHARQRIGVMLQQASLPDTLSVRELIALTASYYPDPHSIEFTATLAGVGDFLDQRYARLSGGQQRRVQFALAICGKPDLLFLDEPTTGLDIEARQAIWAAIRAHTRAGGAVLLTTHYLEEAEALADRVAVIGQGRILAEGTVADISARIVHRRIRCTTRLTPDAVATWPGVLGVHIDGSRLDITTDATESVLRRLLAADAEVCELEVERAGLTDVFLQLTRSEPMHALPEAA